jgi:hypothetical protein
MSARRVSRRFVAIALAAVGTAAAWRFGMASSSRDELELKWVWKGTAAAKAIVEIEAIEKEGGGLFGLRRSPSMADYLPEARVLTGVVLASTATAKRIRLRIPQKELPPVAAGDRVALALTGENTCFCIVPVPGEIAAEGLAAWLAGWTCEK